MGCQSNSHVYKKLYIQQLFTTKIILHASNAQKLYHFYSLRKRIGKIIVFVDFVTLKLEIFGVEPLFVPFLNYEKLQHNLLLLNYNYPSCLFGLTRLPSFKSIQFIEFLSTSCSLHFIKYYVIKLNFLKQTFEFV